SFLLYAMMLMAFFGIIGCHPDLSIPAFTGFTDTIMPTGNSLGGMFPALFITIACGAISGFHAVVSSGTTSKQLDREKDARPIAYGGMLIECVLAVISLCAVGYIWQLYAVDKTVVAPTAVFATGIASMIQKICGDSQMAYSIAYAMLILTVSSFCLTSLDTATRLSRYMFQEFWLSQGETIKSVTGIKRILCNPYIATIITAIFGISLGMAGYDKIWALFGAANQLLATLGLLAVASWLGKIGKNNRMFFIPMIFMLVATITSLAFTVKSNIKNIIGLANHTFAEDVLAKMDAPVWYYIRTIIAVLLIVLAIVLTIEGIQTFRKQMAAKKITGAEE
ncbi:MAG: carbon starvation protein A, partial [Clostridia bacterium]|nr:carbon starvation protein A [Clostridia bacterium]